LPAVVVDVPAPPVIAIYGKQAAERLGLRSAPTHLLLTFDRLPTTDEEDSARQSLRDAGLGAELTVERGYRSDYGLGLLALVAGAALVTLGAAGIATGLAQADARADHATLAAVGATPRLRRTLAAGQALAVAGLGSLLGVVAGLVPGLAFIGAVDALEVAVPWATLAELLVGIPLVAAGSAWLLTRSRLPLERRAAL
jgi:putative ABC transport system permease protein